MNIAEYSIRRKTVTLFLTGLMILGGMAAYSGLGKLEDPEFTIKTAVVSTPYPGASPREVEDEVTEVLESAVQQMAQVKRVRSLSGEGVSLIYVDMKDTYTAADLPQIWDELRRKVGDTARRLPPGAGPSLVNDDYGAVFGLYFALTGEGYTYRELEDVAKALRKDLLLVQDVARVEISGTQQEVVNVEISNARLRQQGISLPEIVTALKGQNLVASAGKAHIGAEYLRISPTGDFGSVEEIGNLILRGTLRLKDVAEIRREFLAPPRSVMFFNGLPALGLGIANVPGSNVVALGERVKKRLAELTDTIPVGMVLTPIYYQSDTVQDSIDNFIVNLLEALVIVIGLLLLFMGLRSGLLIGAILLLTILATFIVMKMVKIDLQSISLGALIIALGMLVDNAIVVVDGMLVGIQRGEDRLRAATSIVSQTQMPLLGATIIAVLSFAPIGLSPDNTGEFCRSLFQVVGISLLLSWVLAVTVTPLAGYLFLEAPPEGSAIDPYDTPTYRAYRRFLDTCLHHRRLALALLGGMLVLGFVGFGQVDKSFFPSSTTPMFTVDFWLPRGTHIDETIAEVKAFQNFLLAQPETESVTGFAGEGALRFILTYTPADPGNDYGHLIVRAKDPEQSAALQRKIDEFAARELVNLDPKVRPFAKGTSSKAKVQVRLLGDDSDELWKAGEEIRRVMRDDPQAINIREVWGNRVKTLRPRLSEARARQAGLTRNDVASALQMAFGGAQAGVYREKDRLLPILARLPQPENNADVAIEEVQVWSPTFGSYLALNQVIERFDTVAEDPSIYRRNRMREFTIECDARDDKSGALFARLRPRVEALPLPPGCRLEWGGEYEDSRDAQGGLMGMIPLGILAIVVILVLLFNSLRKPAIILACLPLSVIGMTAGLLLMRESFSFMALLGFLSLAGMLIKNAIVLIDQIDLEIAEGKEPYDAIVDSAVSRARPVMMAAMTTVLGMIPLYFDILFASMAVTIMFGLTFATVLTLVVVPVFYAVAFRVYPRVVLERKDHPCS